jgi:hypothetical protein
MSSTSMQIQSILLPLASQLPWILVCLIGMILALAQIQPLPRVALITSLAFGLLLFLSVVQPIIHVVLMNGLMKVMQSGQRPMNYSLVSAGIAFGFSILRAIPLALLGYTAFVDRPGPFVSAAKQSFATPPFKTV